MKKPATSSVFLLVLAAALVSYVFYPMMNGIAGSFIVDGAFSLSRYGELLSESTLDAIGNSVGVSVLTVLIGAVLGSLVAFTLSRLKSSIGRVAEILAVIPVAMPPLVGVIAFLFVFGGGGIIPRSFEELTGIDGSFLTVDGFAAVVLVHVYSFHVYTYLFVSGALRQIDGSLLEAASSLGASPARTFRKVVLPELLPALTGGGALTFMSSMASFSAPLLFGGGRPFLTTLIYSTKLNGDIELAGAQSAMLMAVSVIFFLILNSSAWRGNRRSAGKGTSRRGMLGIGKGFERILIVLTFFLLFLEMLPLITIGIISFAREGSWTTQILPDLYTIENYTKLLTDSQVFVPVRNSVLMSVLTVCAAALAGTALAFSLTKGVLKRWRTMADPLLSLPFAIPGTVIAVYLLYSYGTPGITTGGAVLLGTFWILPLAYFIRTYPFVLRSVSSSLETLDDSIIEAAGLFGSGPYRNFRKIVLPLVVPGLIAGSLLVLIAAVGEFPSSVMLYAHSNRPVSVEILALLRGYNFGSAAAYSVVLLIIVLGFSRIAEMVTRCQMRGGHGYLWR